MGVVFQVGLQGASVHPAQGHSVAGDLPVQGEVAHQINGRLEHQHPVQIRSAGKPEGDALIAPWHVPLETAAIQVVCAAPAGEHWSPPGISAHEYTVVVLGVLIQKAGVQKRPDHLRRDAPLFQIGEYPAMVCSRRGKDKGGAFLLCGERRGRVSGGVPGPAAVGQQVLYRLREALTAEPLEECDGVSAGVLGVAEPGAAVFDAETVHLLCGVIPADLLNMVPQGLQQIRQICLPGGLHLCVCESVDCACFRFSHLLPENEKQPGEMPRRQGASPGCFPLIVSYSSGWGLTSSAFSAPCAGSCSVSGVMLSSCS